jgi:hypothetical protein
MVVLLDILLMNIGQRVNMNWNGIV